MPEIFDGLCEGERDRFEVACPPGDDGNDAVTVRLSIFDRDPSVVNLTLFAASDAPGAPRLTARLGAAEREELLGGLMFYAALLFDGDTPEKG